MRRGSDSFRKQSSIGSEIGSGGIPRGQQGKSGDAVPSGAARKVSVASGRRQRFDSTLSSESQVEQKMQRKSVVGQPPGQGGPTFRKRSTAVQQSPESQGPLRPSWGGPSLMGMIAGKKFAKKWVSRCPRHRKTSSSEGGQSWNSTPYGPRLEPTYRMEPQKRFSIKKVEAVIKDTLEERLTDFKYTSRLGPMMSKILTEEIKENVKALCFDRYKIVVSVALGEKKNQGLRLSSRCTWDEHLDSHATYAFENADIFCSVTVYGVYFE